MIILWILLGIAGVVGIWKLIVGTMPEEARKTQTPTPEDNAAWQKLVEKHEIRFAAAKQMFEANHQVSIDELKKQCEVDGKYDLSKLETK